MDRVIPAVNVFVGGKIGEKFVEPPPFDLDAVYDESSCITPLLFVLTPGMDPTGQLRALAVSRSMNWQTVSLGQGQAPKAVKMKGHTTCSDFGYLHRQLQSSPSLFCKTVLS